MAYYYSLIILKFIIGFAIVITHMNLSGKTAAFPNDSY